MVKTDFYKNTNKYILVKTYSSENFKIQKVGTNEIYDMAIDIGYYNSNTQSYLPLNYSYIETNEKIKTQEEIEQELQTLQKGGVENE